MFSALLDVETGWTLSVVISWELVEAAAVAVVARISSTLVVVAAAASTTVVLGMS